MGFIDSLYILNDTNQLLFEQIFTASCPSFAFLRTQLESHKKNCLTLSESTTDADVYSESVFVGSNGEDLESVIKLDATYLAAWARFGNLYIVVVGTIAKKTVDIVSDDENDEDEDDKEASDKEIYEDQDSSKNGYVSVQGYEVETNPFADSNMQHFQNEQVESNPNVYTLSNTVHPLHYMSFLKTFYEILEAFLVSPLTQHKIETNTHNIMLLLQEIVDLDTPYITDINQLKELLPNNSIINQIISTTKQISKTATTSINNMAQNPATGLQASASSIHSIVGGTSKESAGSIFQKSGNSIPWRQMNIKNPANEFLVDIKETLTMIIPPKKRSSIDDVNLSSYYSSYSQPSRLRGSKTSYPVVANITGRLEVRSSLPGTPQLGLNVNLKNHELGVPSFHRCVDVEKWVQTPGYLTFVPPDGSFTLMEYDIDLLNNGTNSSSASDVARYSGLVEVELITGLGIKKNEFEIKVNTLVSEGVQKIDNLRIEIVLNGWKSADDESSNGHIVRSLRLTHGDLQQNENKNFEWVFEKTIPPGLSSTFKGIITSENDAYQGHDDTELTKIVRPSMLKVGYSNRGSIPSGLKVGSITVNRLDNTNTNLPKPYKGVRYITEIGSYIVR